MYILFCIFDTTNLIIEIQPNCMQVSLSLKCFSENKLYVNPGTPLKVLELNHHTSSGNISRGATKCKNFKGH